VSHKSAGSFLLRVCRFLLRPSHKNCEIQHHNFQTIACVIYVHTQPSSAGPCPQSTRYFKTRKQHVSEAIFVSVFRPEAPNMSDALYPTIPSHSVAHRRLNTPLRTESVAGPQKDPALEFLLSGTHCSETNWLSNMFDSVKIGSFCTVGVGVWNFSDCVMALYGVSMV
jgi:hypothetical protein